MRPCHVIRLITSAATASDQNQYWMSGKRKSQDSAGEGDVGVAAASAIRRIGFFAQNLGWHETVRASLAVLRGSSVGPAP